MIFQPYTDFERASLNRQLITEMRRTERIYDRYTGRYTREIRKSVDAMKIAILKDLKKMTKREVALKYGISDTGLYNAMARWRC